MLIDLSGIYRKEHYMFISTFVLAASAAHITIDPAPLTGERVKTRLGLVYHGYTNS